MKKTKLMKINLAIALMLFGFSSMAQIPTPAPSPSGSVSGKVGLTDIEINYSRPQTKGRKIFGSGDDFLLPYGVMWRAGANAGTTVKFSDDVEIGNEKLAAGEYLLLATPDKDEWTVFFYTDISMGGNLAAFDESKTALKVSIKPSKLTETVSTLTYNISDISDDSQSAFIQMAWENTSVKIPVTVSFDEKVMKAIAKGTKVNVANYASAANYYLTTGKDLKQALEWMNLYLAEGQNSKQFWHVHTKAKIQAKMGDKKGAKETAKKSMELAKNSPQGDFGYIKRNEDLIAEL